MNAIAMADVFKQTFKEWSEDKAAWLGAALAYYTIFAIGPLLLVIVAIAGLAFGQEAAQGRIAEALQGAVGKDAATTIQEIVKSAGTGGTGILAGVIGVVMLLLGASGLFGQLQDALNVIWDVPRKSGGGLVGILKQRIPPFLMVLGAGLLLLLSLAANAILSVLGDFLSSALPGGAILWQVVNFAIALGIMVLLFAVIFKVLPDTRIEWGDVWVGAALTALLFTLGQIALGFYLSISNVGSPYGAAGSLVVILVWVYYSAQIFFFGAEFTQVYARRRHRTEEAAERRGQALAGRAMRRGASIRLSPWFR